MSLPAPIRRAIADFIALDGRGAAQREAAALPFILAGGAAILTALAALLEN